jgi:hypothetical protein
MTPSNIGKWFIHCDTDRVEYSLTKDELENISSAAENVWKDFCIGSISVGIPCLLNAVSEICSKWPKFDVTLLLFLNVMIGGLGAILGIVFYVMWRKTKKSVRNIVDRIKNKPKVEFHPGISDIGPIEESRVVEK